MDLPYTHTNIKLQCACVLLTMTVKPDHSIEPAKIFMFQDSEKFNYQTIPVSRFKTLRVWCTQKSGGNTQMYM